MVSAPAVRISFPRPQVFNPELVSAMVPEKFGAIGDGVTNDTNAFQALTDAVELQGGGLIDLRPGATYIVGTQSLTNAGGWMFTGEDILKFDGLTKPLIIRGNGAKIKLAPGLRFGTFNAAGVATNNPLPYSGGERSRPVNEGVVNIQNCTGPVKIENLFLDGNLDNLNIGGPAGDVGYQIPGDGLALFRNREVHLLNVHAHYCPRDGLHQSSIGTNEAATSFPNTAVNCSFLHNGRNNMSLIGGKGFHYKGCRFNYAAQGVIYSPPASGVDIEAEHGPIRRVKFEQCEFDDNRQNGMVADSGDSSHVTFEHCRFIGTTGPAAWTRKPNFLYDYCQFVGPLVTGWGNGLYEAVQFNSCFFTDRVAYSPNGVVSSTAILLDFGGSPGGGQFFRRCRFDTNTASAITVTGAIFEDCQFNSTAATTSSMGSCIFRGTNAFTGAATASVSGSSFYGPLTVAGVDQLGGTITVPAGTVVAAGGSWTGSLNMSGKIGVGPGRFLGEFVSTGANSIANYLQNMHLIVRHVGSSFVEATIHNYSAVSETITDTGVITIQRRSL